MVKLATDGLRVKWKTFFFSEITKAGHKLSKTFYFIEISHVLAELWILWFFVVLFTKKEWFPAKTAVVFLVNCMFFQTTPTRYDQYCWKLAYFITNNIFWHTIFSISVPESLNNIRYLYEKDVQTVPIRSFIVFL